MSILEDVSEKSVFLFVEFRRTRQLTRWLNMTREKTTTDKSILFRALFRCRKLLNCASELIVVYYERLCSCFCSFCEAILCILLVRGGIEPNPGPHVDPGFSVLSQNCRGLTDRNKLFKIMRKIYPSKSRSLSSDIACLQETHHIDRYAISQFFKGSAVIDDGERNQRGVCTLVPEMFEVCSSVTSGIGRWIITVVKAKAPQVSSKLVVVNLYAPNCHRQSVGFYQDLFRSIDDVTEPMVRSNENYDVVIMGDFNAVLDYQRGASDRIGSRAEKDLAKVIKDLCEERGLREALSKDNESSYTWRRGTCLSKLDYCFLSTALFARSLPVDIKWHEFGANMDHASVRVQIKSNLKCARGRSFPKLFKTDISSELDRQWLKDQLIQQESQIPHQWSPHLKLDFIKMILRSKALELRQMRKFTNNCIELREEIKQLIMSAPLNAEKAAKLDTLKLRLYDLEELESETLSIKAGVRWREDGEKSTSFFLARFKARSESAVMHALNLGTRIVHNSNDILSAVQQFYARLYNKATPAHLRDRTLVDNFFANCPTLDGGQKVALGRPLEPGELTEALKTCKESSPGLDGIPYSFYKAFPDVLLKYVLESWEYALRQESLADSHRRSCITLLPKKSKDLSRIGNWRPISLSPCDLKIITKAYANRLKVILPNILSEAQAAYMPGRDINFNNRLLRYARSYSVSQMKDYCVVSLDAQKAFDSVSHEYIVKVLEIYDFPAEFIKVFRTLYSSLTSVVQVNGFLSKEFSITTGVKQGDALSCGLFVLAIDPLLRNLQVNPHIEGLGLPLNPFEVAEIKVLSYADDITIVSKNSNLQGIFTEYERFSAMSGLVLNADKTEVFNFIQSPRSMSRIRYCGEHYDVGRVNRIRLCGMWMAQTDEDDYNLNVCDRIESMEEVIRSWGRRHLTLNGRMILAKTFVMSLIVFPAQIVQINKKEIRRIEKLIYSFVNGTRNLYGPERIARANLKAARELGGINGIDVESFLKSIAVKQFVKASNSHRILRSLQFARDIPMDGICKVAREVLRINYKQHAPAFSMPNLQQLEAISGIPLSILLGSTTQASAQAANEQLDTLGDLQHAYINNLNNRTRINLILRALPRPFSNLIRSGSLHHSPIRIVWCTSDSIDSAALLKSKSIRQALVLKKYPDLKIAIEKIYKRADWPPPGKELEFEATYPNLLCVKNPTLRAIRHKILYKDVFSNERRYRFGLTNSPSCDICGQTETVEHQLFTCRNSQKLWNLYHRFTNQHIAHFYEVLTCSKSPSHEIVKSVILKALIQIDRSKDRSTQEIISQCKFFLRIEASIDKKNSNEIMQLLNKLNNLP